ncbi:MAG: segregation and condensation protein A [Limisphaerales bacterium]|jgi:segregation and condensation protein A
MDQSETYQINLPQFEGPFDLLLFFIERDELDIYDIPISKITENFLAYIHEMKTLDIDLASEFILVASTLMRIKAKMLIPRKEIDEEGNEIDPRGDLVAALLEYKRYKEILEDLKDLESKRHLQHGRGDTSAETNVISDAFAAETELSNLSLYKLMRSFQKVLDRLDDRKEKLSHQVIPYPYNTDDRKEDIMKMIGDKPKLDFEAVFTGCIDKVHAIFTLLAILDLVQQQLLKIEVEEGFNSFWLERRPTEEVETADVVEAE